ncbi:DUF397 domain-containing protein [Spirillospora sp. CA-253888]
MDLFHPRLAWRKSRHSEANGGCVEVAPVHGHDVIAVRDSYDPQGPRLAFTPQAWDAFTAHVRAGGRRL